jgi:hypothetical protein
MMLIMSLFALKLISSGKNGNSKPEVARKFGQTVK